MTTTVDVLGLVHRTVVEFARCTSADWSGSTARHFAPGSPASTIDC
jgi:hypothetical protein